MAKSLPSVQDYGLMFLLALIWGGSFTLIKMTLIDFSPLIITSVRLWLAAIILSGYAFLHGDHLAFRSRDWGFVVFCGGVGTALPFLLITTAERAVDAGLASILMGLMPILTLLFAHFIEPDERLNRYKFIGVLVGLCGLIILVGPGFLLEIGDSFWGQIMLLGAASCYAMNAIATKRIVHLPRALVGALVLASAAICLTLVWLFIGEPINTSPQISSIIALLALAVFPTAIATLLLFEVLDRQGANFVGQVNLLVPVLGVIWAFVILEEFPSLNALIALVMILIGIGISRRMPKE